jgi:hypothetical protein
MNTLDEIATALERKADFWRTNPDDPNRINTPVYVALKEVAEAIRSEQKFRPEGKNE